MDLPEKELIQLDKNVQDFFDSLGPNDVYKRVLLEVFLEEIYGKRIDLSKIMKWDE